MVAFTRAPDDITTQCVSGTTIGSKVNTAVLTTWACLMKENNPRGLLCATWTSPTYGSFSGFESMIRTGAGVTCPLG